MSKKISLEVVNKLLSDVPSDKYFYVNNGPIVKNMEDLLAALENISDEQFAYHRNHEKNDFYNWVISVIMDKRLANDLARAKTRITAAAKVKLRIDSLRKVT